MQKLPEGIRKIPIEEIETEAVLIGDTRLACNQCGKEYVLDGGIPQLLEDMRREELTEERTEYLCPEHQKEQSNG